MLTEQAKAPFFLSNSRVYTHNNDYDAIIYGINTMLTLLVLMHVSVPNVNLFNNYYFLNQFVISEVLSVQRITKTDCYKRVCYIQRIMHCVDRRFEGTAKRCKTNSHTVESRAVPSVSYVINKPDKICSAQKKVCIIIEEKELRYLPYMNGK